MTRDMFPEAVTAMRAAMDAPLADKIAMSIQLLRHYEPLALKLSPDGYWLAYSGGKDSDVILQLAKLAGVKYKAVYNVTTLDPPELTRYIRREHKEVTWNLPKISMLRMFLESAKGPPTRLARWCCQVYKEQGGNGTVKIIGVRAAESPRRAATWKQYTVHRSGDEHGSVICPALYWTDADVWAFHRQQGIPHCELYDEGWTRLGCIGCPLAGPINQRKEFDRWPKFEAAWKRAFEAYWNRWYGVPTLRGKRRYFEDFGSWQGLWDWWISGKRKDDGDPCQIKLMYTNAPDDEDREP